MEIPFERDITILVGENDSGKTSIIDVLKAIFENKSVEPDDLYYGTEKILIEIEIDELPFILEFKKYKDTIQSKTMVKLDKNYLKKLEVELNSDNFKSLTEEEKRNRLVNYANILGVEFRGNIGTTSLEERTLERIEEISNSKDKNIEGSIPDRNVYFLDGKHFEDISIFFREMFFKEIRKEIWNERIEGMTIEDIIIKKLENYSETLQIQIEKKGIKDKKTKMGMMSWIVRLHPPTFIARTERIIPMEQAADSPVAIPFLFLLNTCIKLLISPVSVPAARLAPRICSPISDSSLITSAPQSASWELAAGPTTTCPIETTLTPSSIPAIFMVSFYWLIIPV